MSKTPNKSQISTLKNYVQNSIEKKKFEAIEKDLKPEVTSILAAMNWTPIILDGFEFRPAERKAYKYSPQLEVMMADLAEKAKKIKALQECEVKLGKAKEVPEETTKFFQLVEAK